MAGIQGLSTPVPLPTGEDEDLGATLSKWDKARNTISSQEEQSVAEIEEECDKKCADIHAALEAEAKSHIESVRNHASVQREAISQAERGLYDSGTSLPDQPEHSEVNPNLSALILLSSLGKWKQENLLGSLFTWPPVVNHRVLPLLRSDDRRASAASECLFVYSASPPYFLELFYEKGLFVSVGDGERRPVGKKGMYHWGGCLTPDHTMAFCTTRTGRSILKYSLSTPCDPKLLTEIKIGEATELGGITYSPETTFLAVSDYTLARIFVLSVDGSIVHMINMVEGDVRVLGAPLSIAWRPGGKHLFVADEGSGSVWPSVMMLEMFPARAVWRTHMTSPQGLWVLSGLLHINEDYKSSKIRVVSPEDGRMVGSFTCPAHPLGMADDGKGGVLVMSYEQ